MNLIYDPTNGLTSNGDIYINNSNTAGDTIQTIKNAPALRNIKSNYDKILNKWKIKLKYITIKQYPNRNYDNFEW